MLVYTVFTLVVISLFYLYRNITNKYDYWRKRNVPYIKPSFIFGNYKDYILMRKFSGKLAQEICQQFPDEPYVGVYYGTDPALLIKDPNLVKLVLAKDFYYFNQREISQHIHKERVSKNLFLTGGDTWKVLRQNLTPFFTSAKIKNMFHLIESCASSLETALNKEISKSNIIDIKAFSARYTMECIGSCAFGISTGTLTDETSSNMFTIIGHKLFDDSYIGAWKFVIRSMWPNLFYSLGFQLTPIEVQNFFESVITQVFKSRKYEASSRNDFIDLILSWKKNQHIKGDSISNINSKVKKTVNLDVDDNLLISQCIMFFGAGFETTATTLTFLLYELSKNQKVQSRVIEEVDDYYKRHKGKIEYDCLNEMSFSQACVNETLRIYPVLGFVTREVSEEYTLPTGLQLEKGTRIHVPVFYMHRNPEYFPEPEEFRPERFYGDAEKNIIPYTFMPFGEGSRICIGLRFSKMPLGAAILTIFKNYRVELTEGMPLKLEFDPRAFATQANCDIHLKFVERKK
ncbi:unnamed protein product [Euphydryas editha]|uniref:unspecific monooxygenase n=1 Tax=Euphydryas editha TaxID=104508 RepID=A0AAU9U8Q1_EUPED|nr:unnamed protein product [Euphydryas editha]